MHDFETKKRQVLDRVDILDVVSEHVTVKRRGRRWVGLCPFHAEKTPSFTVTPELGLFKCFGCGKGGDVFSFVQLRENVPFIEAMKMLADRAGIELAPTRGSSTGGPGRAELAKVNAWAVEFFRSNLRHEAVGRDAREYLRGRRIPDAMVERFGIGLATDGAPALREAAARAGIGLPLLLAADLVRQSEDNRIYDTFRSRLMFPIRDATRRVVGFGGRTLANDRAKYLNTRQNALFDKGRGLYGIDLARDAMSTRRRAVVVEGYTDCIAAHQADFTETVATLGTAMTEAQVDLLRRYCDETILLFDSDEAGEAAADRAIRVALPRSVAVRLARIPDGKDPSDFLLHHGADAFSDVLNGAVDALEFKWSQTRARFEGDASDAGRREAILDLLRIVAQACSAGALDEIQRGQLVLKVARMLEIEAKEVNHLMARLQGRLTGRVERSHPTPPHDKGHAWVTVLEVVLNEPAMLRTVDTLPPPQKTVNECDRRIVRMVVDLSRSMGEFRLTDVLAQCHDPADAQRVEELARRGAQRGNYERTLEVAAERIRHACVDREVEVSKQRLLGARETAESGVSAEDELASIHHGVKGRRHYAPRRLIRLTGGGTKSP